MFERAYSELRLEYKAELNAILVSSSVARWIELTEGLVKEEMANLDFDDPENLQKQYKYYTQQLEMLQEVKDVIEKARSAMHRVGE